MHERAKLAGGKLNIWSVPDSGTEIELTILAALPDVKASPPAMYVSIKVTSNLSFSTYNLLKMILLC